MFSATVGRARAEMIDAQPDDDPIANLSARFRANTSYAEIGVQTTSFVNEAARGEGFLHAEIVGMVR